MALNWLEDIVSHLYRLKDYTVVENEDLLMPRTEYRGVRGHSDIDIIAIKGSELTHVECQSWWGAFKKTDEQKEFRRLKDRFEQARELFLTSEKYSFLNQSSLKMRNIFVTTDETKNKPRGGRWDKLQQFCSSNGIELVEIKSVVSDLIAELRKKYPSPQKVGKEEGITRALLYLAQHEFLK